MKLEFPFMTSSVKLNKKDLSFFYYDVATETIDNLLRVVDINDYNIKSFIDENNIVFTALKGKQKLLHNSLNSASSVILFKYNEKVENVAESFIRHLRNAFAHCQIYKSGSKFFIKDIDYKKKKNGSDNITMLAYIEDKLLFELVHRIIYIKEEIRQQTL